MPTAKTSWGFTGYLTEAQPATLPLACGLNVGQASFARPVDLAGRYNVHQAQGLTVSRCHTAVESDLPLF